MTPPTFWRRISQRSILGQGSSNDVNGNATQEADDSAETLSPHHDRDRNLSHQSSNATIRVSDLAQRDEEESTSAGPPLSRSRNALFMIVLNLSVLGAQMAWCLELSYGTPYLLSLGLSPQATSLVWLAGPISGLLAQPVIGSISDASTSSFRRRYYMLFSTAFIFTSTLTLAFSQPIAEVIIDFLNLGLGDWDPVRQSHVKSATQFLAIVSFWILDFALNGLQAAGRALVLDTLKSQEMDYGNAWLGRMVHLGNILGYGAGYLNLSHVAALHWLGGDQFRKFAFVSLLGLSVSVGITCTFIQEHSPEEEESTFSSPHHGTKAQPSVWQILKRTTSDVTSAIRRLPRPIRRVCMVQLVAWMGWFPFLFYATTWIGTFEKTGGGVKEREKRERKGNEGMLLFAVVSLVFGSLLPLFAVADKRGSSGGLRGLLSLASPHSHGITSRTYWTASCVLFAFLMACTLLVRTSTQAVWLIGLIGIPWSINGWVPLSLVMAFVKEAESGLSEHEFPEDYYSPARIAQRRAVDTRRQVEASLTDCAPLPSTLGNSTIRPRKPSQQQTTPRMTSGSYISRGSQIASGGQDTMDSSSHSHRSHSGITLPRDYDDEARDEDENAQEGGENTPFISPQDTHSRGGTILGIHNLSIVIPQFVVSLISSGIFAHFEPSDDVEVPEGSAPGTVWVLCFGAAAALVAAALTRFVPLTRRERLIRGGGLEDDYDDDAEDDTM